MRQTDYPEDAILSVKRAAEMAHVGEGAIRKALKEGALAGRNVGGSTGWVTTWGALKAWAEGHDASGGEA